MKRQDSQTEFESMFQEEIWRIWLWQKEAEEQAALRKIKARGKATGRKNRTRGWWIARKIRARFSS